MGKLLKSVFWIAGEKSGDLHAAQVLKSLKKLEVKPHHYGIGGPEMEKEGFESLFPFERFNVMGFTEVIKHIRFFLKTEKIIRKKLSENRPDLVILVDYPGFNMRIARIADDLSIPVLWFIAPQFWAWKHNRIYKLKAYTRHVACILPFEPELLQINRVNCSFVGHPIAEEIELTTTREDFAARFGLNPEKKWIGFLPGSRKQEVKRMLPEFLKTTKQMRGSGYEFLISKTSNLPTKLYFGMINDADVKEIFMITGSSYEMMNHCDFLVVTSGTATLETAYIGTPFCIVYKTGTLSYLIGKNLIKISSVGLPNIIMDRKIVPELIQHDCNARTIRGTIEKYMDHKLLYQQMADQLTIIKKLLGSKSASTEMTNIVENLLKDRMWLHDESFTRTL
ncbi:MAG: lipid-A-disaccharide synthase [Candidatus Cloacimonetes bacterium]|nr:lipid-A-disaccharide synthase [Candidatus Cloacimonadota bacterium]